MYNTVAVPCAYGTVPTAPYVYETTPFVVLARKTIPYNIGHMGLSHTCKGQSLWYTQDIGHRRFGGPGGAGPLLKIKL